jgi:radical SAM superfamily enzyme YgiQ (UPF0313 family)
MIVISSVPYTETGAPLLAPALLKSCVTNAGYNAVAIDLNFEILDKIKNSPNKWKIFNFFRTQHIDDGIDQELGELIEYAATRLLEHNPSIIGLSLLTQDCQFFTVWLCYHLKYTAPATKIVIGGSGVKSFIAQSEINFGESLYESKLIDAYINGDGEYALVEYIKGNLEYPGINASTWKPIQNLNELPFADFSDYNLNNYPQQSITICDSRGCVRTCEFCDIIEHWTKYQYRTAENIFSEMIHQMTKHNITHFVFNNSLTNGNVREFKKLLDLICEYNENNTNQISWEGYFIIRNASQHPEDLWLKLKKSNARLFLGVESVIEPIRIKLGKNFSNTDIDYHLVMAKKYQVPLMLLLIAAYPTETQADFEFTKQWFKDRVEYAGTPVYYVQVSMASILPGTKLKREQENYKLVVGEVPTIWLTEITKISPTDRINYYKELSQLLLSIGFSTNKEDEYSIQVMRDEIDLLIQKTQQV